MDDAIWTNTTAEEPRINADICARIDHDSTRKQNLSQQSPLRAISAGFVSAIKRSVDWEGVFVNFISDGPENGSYGHQEPSAASALS
jgi:hypothetical protein